MIDIFDIISDESSKAEEAHKAAQAALQPVKNNLDELDLIPEAYQICKLVGGKIEEGKVVGGQVEIIDTLHCDRSKNYVPNERAKGKANILKKHDKANTYYVIGMYREINKKPRKQIYIVKQGLLCEIIHEAKA
jgi:hypothetical protein